MRNIPITVLLSFPAPNYTDPQTQGKSLIVVNAVFAGLVVAVVLLRLYTRIFLKRWVGIDDFWITVALLFTLGLNATVILANAKYYWDRHIWDIPLKKIAGVGKIAMAAKVLFVMASFSTRQSLLCFYYRLTVDTGFKRYKWIMHSATAFNIAICVTFVPLAIFQCSPISAYWTFPASGKCIDEGISTLIVGIINCFADLLITILPIPMIMKLKMPLKQRLGVAVLLGLGLIVTIAGTIRTYYIYKSLIASYDETWFAYPLWICAAVEIDLAVLCACAPTLRPLLISLTKPIISSFTSMYDKGSRAGYASNEPGVLSSNATGHTLNGNTATNTDVDYELEKVGGKVDVEGSSQAESPKRKWSKSWRRESIQEELGVPKSPTILTIMESRSFEVRHENRAQPVGRPSQESYLHLDDSANDLRNQWLGRNRSPGEKMFGHQHHEPTPRSMLRAPERTLALQTPTPVSTLCQSLGDAQSTPANQLHLERESRQPPHQDSFYISQGSHDSDNSSRSEKSEEWPLRPETATSKSELRASERRWDIERNPFRDGNSVATSDIRPRATTSEGIPDQSRWASDPRLWEDIHSQKGAMNHSRSNSVKGQTGGIARMI